MTSFCLFLGMSCLFTKNMVLVPCTLPGIPCTSLLFLLPYECCHVCFYWGWLQNCSYSNKAPMSSSMMAPTKSGFPPFWLVPGSFGCLLRANIHSWVMVWVAVQERVFAVGLVCTCNGVSSGFGRGMQQYSTVQEMSLW